MARLKVFLLTPKRSLISSGVLLSVNGRVGPGSAEFVEKYFGEVAETRFADALEREVEFAVGTHGDNCGREYVAGMGLGFENLVVVNHSGAAVVGYDFKTEGRFLLDDDFYFLTAMIM